MAAPTLNPFIVDDGLEPVLAWAKTTASAKAIVRKEHGRRLPKTYAWEPERIDPDWDAEVYRIPLNADPPAEPGLETRKSVLEQATQHVRQD